MQQLLSLPWPHNPFITLKLILYLGDNIDDYEVFYMVLLWFHHNHPKTLASNIEPFVGDYCVTNIMLDRPIHSVRNQGFDTNVRNQHQHSDSDNVRHRIKDTIAIANKAAKMYQNDSNFQFLHDRVSDFFVNRLKSDIENLKKKKKNQTDGDGDGDDDDVILFSMAAGYLPYTGYRAATQLCESIARKLFPWLSHLDPPSRLLGVTFLTGYTDALTKLFLDNAGEVGPEHVVEATICGKRHSNMAVVD
ncbi:hypothetical protein ACFX11_034243 [Malus domestica]